MLDGKEPAEAAAFLAVRPSAASRTPSMGLDHRDRGSSTHAKTAQQVTRRVIRHGRLGAARRSERRGRSRCAATNALNSWQRAATRARALATRGRPRAAPRTDGSPCRRTSPRGSQSALRRPRGTPIVWRAAARAWSWKARVERRLAAAGLSSAEPAPRSPDARARARRQSRLRERTR